ncbi:MAG: DUF4132 domain-containing protein [Micrococcales bacterium]|nr:DUF4132 domain-containing protein [Micrococcales bacterium]
MFKTHPAEALLRTLAKEYPEEAALIGGFVCDGHEPAKALSVKARVVERFVESLYYSIFIGDKDIRNKTWATLAADPSLMTDEQWVRLGQVLSRASAYTADTQCPPGVPSWFWALQDGRDKADSAAARPAFMWDPSFVVPLLTAGEVPEDHIPLTAMTAFFAILVHEDANPLASWKKNRSSHAASAWASYVGQNSTLVPQAIGTSAAGRRRALEWFALYPKLVPPLAPMVVQYAVGPAKTVREAALTLVTGGTLAASSYWSVKIKTPGLDEPLRSQTLAAALDEAKTASIGTVIDFTTRLGDAGHTLLADALARRRGGKRDELLSAALTRNEVVTAAPQVELDIPPAPPLDTSALGEEFVTAFTAAVNRWVNGLERKAQGTDWWADWATKKLKSASRIGPEQIATVRDWLNGEADRPGFATVLPNDLFAGQNLTLLHSARASTTQHKNHTQLNKSTLAQLVGNDTDPRSLAQALALLGIADPVGTVAGIVFRSVRWGETAAERVWPFFAENPQRVDQALDAASSSSEDLSTALQILAAFPAVPTRYLPVVAEIATGETKTHRLTAQQMLENRPDALAIAAEGLKSGKGEVRAAAAAWIGRIGDAGGVEVLRTALAKEKREQPQAAMLTALRILGDDISAHLTPQVLATAATKGLAGKAPAGMAWFPLDALPACRWADGSPVDPDTIRWWAVLAVKLKDPVGAGLIGVYVSLLDTASQEALGTFVLDAWISRDTAHPSDEVCRAHAEANVDARYRDYQSYAKYHSGAEWAQAYIQMTKEQVFDELRREKAREYLGSAISEKGLLALTSGAPGHHVLAVCQRYIRDNPQRRAQVEALVIAAAANDDPSAIQLVLSVARKFKQETVRAKAGELAEQIAERCGWTLDELADRTIPTAGFDDTGVLSLDYGRRVFTGRITRSPKTGAFTIEVSNADGKPLKALPQPGVNDDAETATASRKQLTTSKKELTQVASLQTSRLFEAMCLGRTWDVPVWDDLVAHPIMCHLMSTLVWQTSATPDGQYSLFRPSADGELLDADDETVTLPQGGHVGLAHRATITAAEADQWQAHLADYDVKPLFPQLTEPAPATAAGATAFDDHLGWLSDSFAIRGRATKRGYTRGMAEDGGWFCEYSKELPSARIRVVIEFTGSFLPEEQIPAAVRCLTFERAGRQVPLCDVPPILLAECYADYAYVAQAGTFDPDWEAKSAM